MREGIAFDYNSTIECYFMIQILSKLITFRLVDEGDTDFIYKLRLNRGRFLNNTNFSQESNSNYIKSYRNHIQECIDSGELPQSYYFAIEIKNKIIGTVRLYNIDYVNRLFTWGSWILSKGGGYKQFRAQF